MLTRGVVILALASRVAIADPKQEAEQLFQQGRQLLADGKTDEACAKFEASFVKDPRAVGTLLNLGLCNERRGKVATALRYFQEAFDHATAANMVGQQKVAQEQIAALTPQVPVLAFELPGAPLPGQRLVVDDQVIANDKKDLQVDPGKHAIVLTAPGRLPYETSVTVAVSERKTVKLPALELGHTTIVKRSSTRRIGKIVTAGGGAVVLGAGVLAAIAKHRYDIQFDGANPACGGPRGTTMDGLPICSPYGKSRVDSARSLGTAATVIGGIGLAAVATGVVLWVSSPSDERRPTVAPTASANSLGLAISGRF